jgi:hypothetical protein
MTFMSSSAVEESKLHVLISFDSCKGAKLIAIALNIAQSLRMNALRVRLIAFKRVINRFLSGCSLKDSELPLAGRATALQKLRNIQTGWFVFGL